MWRSARGAAAVPASWVMQAPRFRRGIAASGRVHVLACATEYRQETAILWRSCERNGFEFHPVGVGEPWEGFATKFLSYLRALHGLLCSEAAPGDLVMLQDAWDTVVVGSADELRSKVSSLPEDAILCGAEQVCGPNHFLVGGIEQLYPSESSWRYPNSGGLVGTAEAMVSLLHGLIHDTQSGSVLDASDNDQVRLHEYLLSRADRHDPFPLLLDTRCEVFQCLYQEKADWEVVTIDGKPRLKNQVTGELPIVVHGNGHTGRWFLSDLYSEMRLLQHLSLSMQELSHLPHEMPVAPGTIVTEEIKEKYCPWWYTPGLHKGATDGFSAFYMIRDFQRKARPSR